MFDRLLLLMLLVALLGCRPEPTSTATLAPKDPAPSDDPVQAAYQEVQRKLEQPVDCNFVDKPLLSILKKLGESAGVEIRVDQDALDDVGFPTDTPITLELQQIKLRSALALLRRQIGNGRLLNFHIDGERVLLADVDSRDNQFLPVRFYPCADLLVNPNGPQAAADELVYTLTASIEPESWEELGGPGTAYVESNGLVVSQTDEMQRKVPALLRALEQAKSLPSAKYDPAPIAVDFDPAARGELQRKLRDVEMQFITFRETPLADVVRLISEHCHVQAYLDIDGLQDVGLSGNEPITNSWVTASAETILGDVLRPLRLSLVYHDDFVEITTDEREESMPITKVYPIRDLLRDRRPDAPTAKVNGQEKFAGGGRWDEPPTRAEELIDLLTYSVNPSEWEELGGIGSCQSFWPSDALVVTQSALVHERCERLLATIRRDAQPSPPYVAPPTKPVPPIVVSYDMENDGDAAAMEVFAKSLQEEIEPGTWDGTQRYVRIAGSRLLIKAPPQLQRQIGHWIAVLLRPRPAEEVFNPTGAGCFF